MRTIFSLTVALAIAVFSLPVLAEETLVLPASVTKYAGAPLAETGTGKYRKFGLGIYRAALWAPGGTYDKKKAYVLQVHYLRGLSKDTVVSAVVDDVRAQKMADAATMDEWVKLLTDCLPEVKDGDEIIGVATPGKPSKLFFNGKQIASISDKRLSDSFFNIWLGNIANEDLRAELLGTMAPASR